MLIKLEEDKWSDLIPFLNENILENYYNILGLISEEKVYKKIYVQYCEYGHIKAVLFLRKSGSIKFYAVKGFNPEEIALFLSDLEYTFFIGPGSYSILLRSESILTKSIKITDLCHLKSKVVLETSYKNNIIPINLEDLDKVIEVYKKAFNSFASKDVLKERIGRKRGRGFGIFVDEKLVSVSFTDFETKKESLIVGVATLPEFRNRGYGTELVKYLSNILQNENKEIYLEYNSQVAGNIYKKLGFNVVDSVYKYWD